jgi:hypothetical protein
MMDFINKHFTPLLYAAGILAFVVLVLSVVLFRELAVHYDRTRKAMMRFVQFVSGLRRAAKGDATADDDLAKTITPGEVRASDVQPKP